MARRDTDFACCGEVLRIEIRKGAGIIVDVRNGVGGFACAAGDEHFDVAGSAQQFVDLQTVQADTVDGLFRVVGRTGRDGGKMPLQPGRTTKPKEEKEGKNAPKQAEKNDFGAFVP